MQAGGYDSHELDRIKAEMAEYMERKRMSLPMQCIPR